MTSENSIVFLYTSSDIAQNVGQNHRYFDALNETRRELTALNLSRGGNNTYGFVFEDMHAANKNINNIKYSNGEVIKVLDDNGVADFKTMDANGKVSLQQAKAGYHGANKYKIANEKYDGMTKVIDKGNDEVLDFAQKKGLKYEEATVSKEQAKALTGAMQAEGKLRQSVGLTNNAPVVANLHMAAKQIEAAHSVGINTAKGAAPLAAGISFGKNFYEYLEGDIDLREMLFGTIKETAISLVGAYAGGAVSFFASGVLKDSVLVTIGKGIGVLIPSATAPAFLLGIALGAGCAMCKSISIKNKEYQLKKAKINIAIERALLSMQDAYNSLDVELKKFCVIWDESFNQGFHKMLKSISDNDFEGFTDGLDTVMKVFDAHVLFKTENEFDDFFFDDNAVLNL